MPFARYARAITPPSLRPLVRQLYGAAQRRARTLHAELFDPSRNRYWDSRADDMENWYGHVTHDFATVRAVIADLEAKTILDAGCGAGRLFPVYRDSGVEFVGCDISSKALTIAAAKFPNATLIQIETENICSRTMRRRFELAVSNRHLMHVNPRFIARAVAGITEACRAVYINELIHGEDAGDSDYLFLHDYDALFAVRGLRKLRSGTIYETGGRAQQWALYVGA